MRTRCLFVVVATLVVSGCHNARSHPDSSPQARSPSASVVSLRGIPIARRIGALNAEQTELLRFAMETVPSPLPPEATPIVKFLFNSKQSDARPGVVSAADGVFRDHYVVAAPGGNELRFNLICLRNFAQVRCASSARVWDVVLPPLTMVEAPIEVSVEQGDRLDFLFLIPGDRIRPEPVSQDSHYQIEVNPTHLVAKESKGHAAVFGGCGFATIQPSAQPHAVFRAPKEQSLSRPLYLIVQPPCDATRDPHGETIRVAGVLDRTTVVDLPGLSGPVRITSPALVELIPRLPSLRVGSELQIVVFREVLPGWLTHSVRFIR